MEVLSGFIIYCFDGLFELNFCLSSEIPSLPKIIRPPYWKHLASPKSITHSKLLVLAANGSNNTPKDVA